MRGPLPLAKAPFFFILAHVARLVYHDMINAATARNALEGTRMKGEKCERRKKREWG
jgi:hypothetical protein